MTAEEWAEQVVAQLDRPLFTSEQIAAIGQVTARIDARVREQQVLARASRE